MQNKAFSLVLRILMVTMLLSILLATIIIYSRNSNDVDIPQELDYTAMEKPVVDYE